MNQDIKNEILYMGTAIILLIIGYQSGGGLLRFLSFVLFFLYLFGAWIISLK